MLGVVVMIQSLGGNQETVNNIKSSLGKKIQNVYLDEEEDKLIFNFIDGTVLKIFDNGQSCCEYRYMRTDDNLSYFQGAILLDFELKDAPNIKDEFGSEYSWGEEHEVQFLDVKTSKGIFQMANHNEHNGYYGGFCIVAKCN